MKHFILAAMVLTGMLTIPTTPAMAYNYGDYRSSTLVSKAWQAFEQADVEAVLAYTNKAIELYEEQARGMQSKLTEYPTGTKEKVFSFWALNDIGTAYFIQGEAFRKADMKEEAAKAYNKVIKEFSYAQTWDPAGFFWKPAEAAQEKLNILTSGKDIDYGDMSSSALVQKAWGALAANDVAAVELYVDKVLSLYAEKAQEMQEGLDQFAYGSNEKISSYWALNDVGTALFILGEAYKNAGKTEESAKAFQRLVDSYFFAQTWDPQGWFWKPAEEAQKKLIELEA